MELTKDEEFTLYEGMGTIHSSLIDYSKGTSNLVYIQYQLSFHKGMRS
mgnify:CR=1 FL=1